MLAVIPPIGSIPDWVVVGLMLASIISTVVGGIMRLRSDISSLRQHLDAREEAHAEKHHTHEKRIDDHELRLRLLEKIHP